MDLLNYIENLKKEDNIKRRSKPLNKEFYEQKIKEAFEAGYFKYIEENFLPPFHKLEPFAIRPLSVFYRMIREILFFHSKFPGSGLKEKIEKDYLILFKKDLYEASDILNNNLLFAFKNVLDKKFFNKKNSAKARELEVRMELKKVNREIVNWFNNSFEEYRIYFDSETCGYRASQVRKEINKKYSLELKAMQRERSLLKKQLKL